MVRHGNIVASSLNALRVFESLGREIRKCSSGKRRYLDKVSCEVRIKQAEMVGKVFAYHCPECDQWHMTSKEQK